MLTNWVHDDTMANHRRSAADVLKRVKQERRGKTYLVPHPTLKNTFIEKLK